MDSVKKLIRDIPDFPKKGIIFKDITPILADPTAMAEITGAFEKQFEDLKATRIAGIEARGFVFGSVLAYAMKLPFTPVRKPGKLPYKTVRTIYQLEYGEGTLEMHTDGVGRNDRVIIIDDLLATGGTAGAAVKLIEGQGAKVLALGFVVELEFLGGRKQLGKNKIVSLVTY
ncbi:MAG: adenine phosphoribosyltransferase [Planctomycetes bacterium]|nr:adenine phosphoribosyltransferase [Planctomycetota bacterium]